MNNRKVGIERLDHADLLAAAEGVIDNFEVFFIILGDSRAHHRFRRQKTGAHCPGEQSLTDAAERPDFIWDIMFQCARFTPPLPFPSAFSAGAADGFLDEAALNHIHA